MKNQLRAFGIGIFLAGTFTFIYQNFIDPSSSTPNVKAGYELIESKELEQMKSELSISKEELAQLQLNLDNIEKIKKQQTTQSTSKENNDVPSDGKFLLVIQPGDDSYTIGKTLEEADVLSNAKDLVDYLEGKNLATRIQVGQFELHSTMSLSEIANEITK